MTTEEAIGAEQSARFLPLRFASYKAASVLCSKSSMSSVALVVVRTFEGRRESRGETAPPLWSEVKCGVLICGALGLDDLESMCIGVTLDGRCLGTPRIVSADPRTFSGIEQREQERW